MNLLQRFSQHPIGVDLGKRMIKAVQLDYRHGQPALGATACISRLSDDGTIRREELMRLARVLAQQGFQGRRIVLTAPVQRLLSAVIDLPADPSGAPVGVLAAQSFAQLQRLAPDSFEFAWWDVPKPSRAATAKAMAIGCAHADSRPVLDAFERAGFEVIAMDSGLCAAVRACRAFLGPETSTSAVLDLGWGEARLALVYGGVVVFERFFANAGLAGLCDRMADGLRVRLPEVEALLRSVGLVEAESDDQTTDPRLSLVAPKLYSFISVWLDELIEAVEASFEYTTHLYPNAEACRLVLVGGGACVPGVVSYMNKRIDPEVVTTGADNDLDSPPLMASALGLSGYGILRQAS